MYLQQRLPMDRNSTPATTTLKADKRQCEKQKMLTAPSCSTIDFIKQFARCYTYEPRLSRALGGIIVN